MSTNSTYLAVTEITYLRDGGYLEQTTQLLWVDALNKRNAAERAVRYVKRITLRPLASVKVSRVLANTQWGEAYFTHIRE